MEPTANTPIQPERATFDPNEQLASVFLSNVTDFKTRLSLRAVSTAFLNAEKQEPSTPVDVGTTHMFGEICYATGNFKNAYQWFRKASEQAQGQSTFNKSDSMYNLACCFQAGEGVEKNLDVALKWFKRAAEAGSTDAMVTFGLWYWGKEDIAMMVMWLQRAVAEGDQPDALAVLGETYLNGEGVDKDVKLGIEYFEKAADQGHATAQFELGMMYKEGHEGLVQDVETGLKWLQEAAEQGEAEAQNVLGRHYLQTEKYERSLPYLEKAAAQGHPDAQFGLGVCYGHGFGVEENLETSLDFVLKAAEGGDEGGLQARESAMRKLVEHAVSLVNDGNESNRPEFLRLIRKLADLGNGIAEFLLAGAYRDGMGGSLDLDLHAAARLLHKVIEHEFPPASILVTEWGVKSEEGDALSQLHLGALRAA